MSESPAPDAAQSGSNDQADSVSQATVTIDGTTVYYRPFLCFRGHNNGNNSWITSFSATSGSTSADEYTTVFFEVSDGRRKDRLEGKGIRYSFFTFADGRMQSSGTAGDGLEISVTDSSFSVSGEFYNHPNYLDVEIHGPCKD